MPHTWDIPAKPRDTGRPPHQDVSSQSHIDRGPPPGAAISGPTRLTKAVIILPTYNEKPNIGRIIEALQGQFKNMAPDMHIVVVDDRSPDGTADVVRLKQATYDNVHLLSGPKRGLGAAYIRGMHYATNTLQADIVFEMDADFSHKPEDVPRLMDAIESGADFVIGSRYVPNGTIPREWGIARRLNSRAGNIVARYLAGLYSIRDCTAGFRAIKASLLKRIDVDHIRVTGYAFQVALLHQAVVAGAAVVEVPVDFVERIAGESKLGLSDIAEFIVNAWWIRLKSSRTFAKFSIVGLSGIVVNLGLFTLLLALGLSKYLASPVAIEISIITNFMLNNYWTFRWRRTRGRVFARGVQFNLVSVLALAISYSTFVSVSVLLPRIPPQSAQLAGIFPAMLVNYFMNSYWTFRHVSADDA